MPPSAPPVQRSFVARSPARGWPQAVLDAAERSLTRGVSRPLRLFEQLGELDTHAEGREELIRGIDDTVARIQATIRALGPRLAPEWSRLDLVLEQAGLPPVPGSGVELWGSPDLVVRLARTLAGPEGLRTRAPSARGLVLEAVARETEVQARRWRYLEETFGSGEDVPDLSRATDGALFSSQLLVEALGGTLSLHLFEGAVSWRAELPDWRPLPA